MTIDTKSLVLGQRRDILRRLVELAVRDRKPKDAELYRIEAENLIAELSIAEKMLLVANPPDAGKKYAKSKTVTHAVLLYLKEIDRPVTEGDIVRELTDGGFRGGKPGTGDIQRGLMNRLTGSGKSKGYIKRVGGLFGLTEWDDSRFKTR